MAWTVPRTWSVGELTTAALMNQHLRDNLDILRVPPQASADIGASVSVTATTFADAVTLSGFTPSGYGNVIVGFSGFASCSAAIGAAILAFDITDNGTSIAAGGGWPYQVHSIGAGLYINVSYSVIIPPPSAASHVYKLRAKVSAGTATLYGSSAGFLGRLWAREI